MSVQTSYNFYTERGVAGGLYDLSHHDVNSRINECEDGVLKFGMGVITGGNPGSDVRVPVVGATAFDGITVNGFSTEMDMAGAVALKNGATVGVLAHGKVWARIANGVSTDYGDELYLITDGEYAGYFTNVTEGNLKINGRFVGPKGTGNVAPVELF